MDSVSPAIKSACEKSSSDLLETSYVDNEVIANIDGKEQGSETVYIDKNKCFLEQGNSTSRCGDCHTFR